MAAKEEFQVDHHHDHVTTTTPITPGTSFSQLLFGDDDDDDVHHDKAFAFGAMDQTSYNNNTNSSVFSIHNTPKMLCFANNYQNEGDLLTPPQKSIITSSDNSSSANSCNYSNATTFNSLPMSNSNSLQKKRNVPGQEPGTTANFGRQRPPYKKNKAETGHANSKRKEKLGERIAALQQLVSPFGKTDTASVLHEATGYIRFLHDQVQVLCSPYLQSLPSSSQPGDGENDGEKVKVKEEKDLRSRGLCLIPVSCTVHVPSTNGADFWSPGNNVKQ